MHDARRSRVNLWARRLVTIPGYVLLCLAGLAAFPLLLALACALDAVRGGAWVRVRCLAFAIFYLCCEVTGIGASLGAWLCSGVWAGGDRARYAAWNFAWEPT